MLRIRPFDPDDLDALYEISLATGLAGGDASHLYADPKLMGHIYSAPYALLEPELALMVEDEKGVAGFAVGTIDTRTWEQKLERAWWPSLRKQYAKPAQVDASGWTPDQRRAFMIHSPTPTPPAVAVRYPAHLHINLLPRLQKRGVGTALFRQWLVVANEHGAKSLHVGINRANVGAVEFWGRMGFDDLVLEGLPEGRTVWKGRQ
jgi:GNAT superfamily N-acetyltransferase